MNPAVRPDSIRRQAYKPCNQKGYMGLHIEYKIHTDLCWCKQKANSWTYARFKFRRHI